MADIKAIDKSTVHRICSGQVVLSLAVAVKEIVENSIDAGATVVDVRLKEFGREQIEVTDNGSGIHPTNFQGLTMKHATSKIRDFSDLMSVETFGFRGEALSSLCALSELSVITRHESQQCGTGLVFDRNGHIIEEKRQARQVGTSVFVKNLFSTLPVRQKEFHKNLKREFHKMTQLLYAYCLVSTGVKITCVNQTQKSAQTTIMATQGSKSVKENISCLFGAKQLNHLLEFKQKEPPAEDLEEMKATIEDCKLFNIEGYVSSCSHGAGKAASNRQFYFINSRPCEPSKIVKQVNQVYHQFNKNQYPFIFLNICLDRGLADVNVTPDKRQIFLLHENLILATIKVSLLDLFDKIPSTLVLNVISPTISVKTGLSGQTVKPNFRQFDAWKHKSDLKRPLDYCDNEKYPPKQIRIEGPTQKTLESFQIKTTFIKDGKQTLKSNLGTLNETNIQDITECNSEITSHHYKFEEPVENSGKHEDLTVNNVEVSQINNADDTIINNCCSQSESQGECSKTEPTVDEFNLNQDEIPNENQQQVLCVNNESVTEMCFINSDEENNSAPFVNEVLNIVEDSNESSAIVYDEYVERDMRSIVCSASLNSIKSAMAKRILECKKVEEEKKNTTVKFRATIEPSKNAEAEKELTKEISKDMFEKMEIIGQFNLGFIIAKLESDLLIIDQHASDEKYNFETLQKTTVINTQRLVVPQSLELAAEHECILIDNIDTFHKNGFKFNIDEDAPPTKKVNLTTIPMSKNVVFGKEDIDEMIFMLQDSQGSSCRPSRVRAMFASRACRKSVMIGTALSQRQMRQLINNMATIDQPWNCPHGRPTIRHLLNLDLIQTTPL